MRTPSSASSTITAPLDYHEIALMLAKLATEAMTCYFAILYYNSVLKSMIEWCWPEDGKGKKVQPSNFQKYHNECKFQYLCCLCASSSERGAYTEAAVYPWRDKITNEMHWNARCAADRCGYRVTFKYPLRGRVQKRRPSRQEPRRFIIDEASSAVCQMALARGVNHQYKLLCREYNDSASAAALPDNLKKTLQGHTPA
ncbi:hypothetical protein BDR05DRAFT_947902 [Suillus weaverae]|nr:hypothetical protein BDR05DRAFT_947902 [Suillus weaverae]